jgi:hypothetical protein
MTVQYDLFFNGLSAGLFQAGLGGQVSVIRAYHSGGWHNYNFCYLGSETITVPYGRLARNKWYFQFNHRVIHYTKLRQPLCHPQRVIQSFVESPARDIRTRTEIQILKLTISKFCACAGHREWLDHLVCTGRKNLEVIPRDLMKSLLR